MDIPIGMDMRQPSNIPPEDPQEGTCFFHTECDYVFAFSDNKWCIIIGAGDPMSHKAAYYLDQVNNYYNKRNKGSQLEFSWY